MIQIYLYLYLYWCGDTNSHPAGPQVVDRGIDLQIWSVNTTLISCEYKNNIFNMQSLTTNQRGTLAIYYCVVMRPAPWLRCKPLEQ